MAGLYERDKVLKVASVGDTIFTAQSLKTPFTRLMKRGKRPPDMITEWPAEFYADQKFEGVMDGTDQTTFTHQNREKLRGYAMPIRTEGWMVSFLSQLTATHGVPIGKEKAKQATVDGLKLGQMIEKQILSTVDTRAEAAPATTYRSRGAFSWLNPDEQGVLPVPANYRPSSSCVHTGTLAAFTPSVFEGMLEAMALAKNELVDLTGFAGLKLKRQMSLWAQRVVTDSGFTMTAQTTRSQSDKKLQQVVNMFEFDAGVVNLFPSMYLACTEGTGAKTEYTTRSGLFLDLSKWELCWLEEPGSFTCSDEGGGPRGFHQATYIAKCLMPLGQGYVYTNADS